MFLRTQGTFRHCYPVYEAPIYHLRQKLYGGYVAGGLALASLIYVIYGATEGKQHFQIREVTISSDELPSGFDGYRIVQISDIHSGSWTGNGAALQKAVNLINAQHADLVLLQVTWSITWQRNWTNLSLF